MPIDYSKYPANWKTEIRPAILARANHRCEQCLVPNYAIILRGTWNGQPAYQDDDGYIYHAETGQKVGADYVGEMDETGRRPMTKIILTIAHLDHDTANNEPENLKALCQYHHLAYDKHLHQSNSRETRNKKRKQTELIFV